MFRYYRNSYPPNRIPEKHEAALTLSGNIPIFYSHRNETITNADAGFFNSAEAYQKVFEALNERTFEYYGQEILAFYDALEQYPLNGKSVLVWGLTGCNCKAITI